MRRGPPAGSRGRGVGRSGLLVVRRVAGPVDDDESGARDAAGDPLRPGTAAVVERAGDDERGTVDGAEAVEERLHRALAGATEARGEARGVVGEADRADPGRRARRAVPAWLANTGWRSHSSTKASMPSRSRRSASASSAARRAARSASILDPGRRALEDETAHDVRVRDGETQRDPGAERVADDVRGRGVEAPQDRGEIVRGALHAHPRRRGRPAAAVTREVDGDHARPARECPRVLAP